MKVSEDAVVEELPLSDERLESPKKLNRHVVIALRHMKARRETLTLNIQRLEAERNDLDDAIKAIDSE